MDSNNTNKTVKTKTDVIVEILKDNAIFVCVIAGAVVIAGELLLSLISFFMEDKDFVHTFNMYAGFWGIWLIGLIVVKVRKKNAIVIKKLKSGGGNTVKLLLIGFGIGFAMNGVCILVAHLHGDFELSFFKFQPIQLIALLVAVFVQSSAEEFICRGYVYQRLKMKYEKEIIAIIVNSAFFALLHIGNDGINILAMVDLFLAGILFSLFIYYFDSLWMAMSAHTAWNFTQNIIFGLPNSGTMSKYSIFMAKEGSLKSSFAFHEEFGLEGTWMSIGIMILSCVLVVLYVKWKKDNPLNNPLSA